MAITKAFVELTPISGDYFSAKISRKETDLPVYVIDGSFVEGDSAPSMSGEDFQEMAHLAFTQEFKDKSTPFFFFSQSKTMVMNFVPTYFSAFYQKPATTVGLFHPAPFRLYRYNSSANTGEIVYDGDTIYIYVKNSSIGNPSGMKYIRVTPSVLARPSDYGYDIDAQKGKIRIDAPGRGWAFGHNRSDTVYIYATSDYVFKCSLEATLETLSIFPLSTIACNSLTANDPETAVVFDDANVDGSASSMAIGSSGFLTRRYESSWLSYASAINSKLNVTATRTDKPSFLISRSLTPQVISSASASYLCSTYNPYGIGEIFTVDTNNQTLTAAGSSYTAIGAVEYIAKTVVADIDQYNLGLRVIANKLDLSGKTSIIKTKHGDGITVASESACYKIGVSSSYSVLRSDDGTDTQADQSYMYCFHKAVKKLYHAGILQCVTDKNNKSLSDSYDTGVIVLSKNLSANSATEVTSKIYVMYDDNSIAISSYNITLSPSQGVRNSVCPMKISGDGKNITAYRPYITKRYTGAPSFTDVAAAGGLPADDAFIVPENRGTKKIEAVGMIYESGTVFDSLYYPNGNVNNGTFLILEPKT